MKNKGIKSIINRHSNKIIILILAIAFFTRIIFLDKIPSGMHVDEAGIMYDAYCFANYGVDRYLNKNPVYLINFGGGQSILYTLICAIFVKIFGYNLFWIRFPNLMFSIIYIIEAYYISKKWKDKGTAILISFLLMIVPYFFIQSRYALDCNLMAPFMLLGIIVLLNSNKKWKYVLSGIIFGLTLYTYILSLIIIPIFLILISMYLLYIKKAKISDIVCIAISVIIFAIPLLLFLLYNKGIININSLGFLTFPKLFGIRTSEISSTNITINIINIIKDFLIIDISTKEFSDFYYITNIFFLIGIIISVKEVIKKIKDKKFDLDIVLIINLISGIGLLFVENLWLYKANAIIISFIYFSAIGIKETIKKFRYTLVPIFCIYTILFICFQIKYFKEYKNIQDNFIYNNSIASVINYAEQSFENEEIWMAVRSFEPYIYQLAENPISPYEFNKVKEIKKNKVVKYGKYSFGYFSERINENTVCIIKAIEYDDINKVKEIKDRLKNMGFKMKKYTVNEDTYEIYYLKEK